MTSLRCLPSPEAPCTGTRNAVAGAQLRLNGRELQATSSVVFRGQRGKADDVGAAAQHVGRRHFEVVVPSAARTGRLDVIVRGQGRVTVPGRVRVTRVTAAEDPSPDVFFAGDRRRPGLAFEAPAGATVRAEVVREPDGAVVRRLTKSARGGNETLAWDGMTDAGPATTGRYTIRLGANDQGVRGAPTASFTLYDHVFPIRGAHDLGQNATNNFGGVRSHQGQDMFAACGTPLVAARGGKVKQAGYHAQAGNYVVISSAATRQDYVYMHLKSTPLVRSGEKVATRQPLGQVGDSGNASGCHLHFELWTSPGWYAGGRAVNPLQLLLTWDGWS